MGQMSVQYTPVQVLQAARRAEAEGKMDYALQFYRHLVEHHGMTAEAQEAREGLFRIAEWRWGEARVARRQDGVNGQPGGQGGGQQSYAPAPGAKQDFAPQPEPSAHMPQIIAREAARAAEAGRQPAFKARYRSARNIAFLLCGVGWASVVTGIVFVALAWIGAVADVSAAGLLGLPLGVLLGVPVAVLGLVLVIAGQLAAAVFESANATLELLALGRERLSL
jgi:hypothetical protein